MPAEMIRDDKTATYPNDPNVWTVVCHDHQPPFHRNRLVQAHAQNVVKKHDREQHPAREFQVGLMAALLLTLHDDMLDTSRDYGSDPDKGWAITFTQRRYQEGLAAWMTLCGLQANQQDEALALARQHAQEGTVAHVAPF